MLIINYSDVKIGTGTDFGISSSFYQLEYGHSSLVFFCWSSFVGQLLVNKYI